MAWADIESILCGLLAAEHESLKGVLTRTPSNRAQQMPLAIVSRFGGGYDGLALDEATVDIDVYAAREDAAKNLCGAIVLHLVGLRNYTTTEGHVLSRISVMTSPLRRPYDSKNQVHRFGVALRVLTHVRHTV